MFQALLFKELIYEGLYSHVLNGVPFCSCRPLVWTVLKREEKTRANAGRDFIVGSRVSQLLLYCCSELSLLVDVVGIWHFSCRLTGDDELRSPCGYVGEGMLKKRGEGEKLFVVCSNLTI